MTLRTTNFWTNCATCVSRLAPEYDSAFFRNDGGRLTDSVDGIASQQRIPFNGINRSTSENGVVFSGRNARPGTLHPNIVVRQGFAWSDVFDCDDRFASHPLDARLLIQNLLTRNLQTL